MIYLLKVLFPYIVLFYVIDCFVSIKKFQVVFYSHFGKKYITKKKGIRFIGFSPFCKFYSSSNFPFFVTEEGIYLWNKDNVDEYDLYEQKYFDLVLFDEIEKIEYDGEILKINGLKKIHLGSTYFAKYFLKKIETLKDCSPESRGKVCEEYFKKPKDMKKVMTRHHYLFFLIQFSETVLFVYTFIFLPCFLYLDTPFKFNYIIFNIITFYVLIIGLSLYAHKKICKNNEKFYLFFFSLLFSPVSAIHALHMITKDITLNTDWIIQSADFLSPEKLKQNLIREMKRIHFSKEKNNSKDLMSFLQFKERQYLPLFLKAGLRQNKILAPPVKNDLAAYCYCPFCETDFIKGVDKCPDCNINLINYD